MTPFEKLLSVIVDFWLEKYRTSRSVFNVGDVTVTFEREAVTEFSEAMAVSGWWEADGSERFSVS